MKYILPLYRNNILIDFTPLGHPGSKKEHSFFIYENRVIWYYAYMKDGERFVTFLDEKLRTEEERDYVLYPEDGYPPGKMREGWLMANFLAMIAYYKLYRKLAETKKLNNYSPKDIVEISKSISSININGQWHTTETTKKTKDLFKKLKIGYLTERS